MDVRHVRRDGITVWCGEELGSEEWRFWDLSHVKRGSGDRQPCAACLDAAQAASQAKADEGVRHVRRADGGAVCGAPLGTTEWAFTDVAHAHAAVEMGTRLQPCTACVEAAELRWRRLEPTGEEMRGT